MVHMHHVIDGGFPAVPDDLAWKHGDEESLRELEDWLPYLRSDETVGDLNGGFIETVSILSQNKRGPNPLHVVIIAAITMPS